MCYKLEKYTDVVLPITNTMGMSGRVIFSGTFFDVGMAGRGDELFSVIGALSSVKVNKSIQLIRKEQKLYKTAICKKQQPINKYLKAKLFYIYAYYPKHHLIRILSL